MLCSSSSKAIAAFASLRSATSLATVSATMSILARAILVLEIHSSCRLSLISLASALGCRIWWAGMVGYLKVSRKRFLIADLIGGVMQILIYLRSPSSSFQTVVLALFLSTISEMERLIFSYFWWLATNCLDLISELSQVADKRSILKAFKNVVLVFLLLGVNSAVLQDFC